MEIPYPCTLLLKGPQSNPNFAILPSPSGILRAAVIIPKHCHYLALQQPPKCYSSLNVHPLPVEGCCCKTIWCFTKVIDKFLRVFSLVIPLSRTLVCKQLSPPWVLKSCSSRLHLDVCCTVNPILPFCRRLSFLRWWLLHSSMVVAPHYKIGKRTVSPSSVRYLV